MIFGSAERFRERRVTTVMEKQEDCVRIPTRLVYVAALVVFSLGVLKVTEQISAPIILALVLGVVMAPLLNLAARSRIPPAAMGLMITVGCAVALAGGIVLVVPLAEAAMHAVPKVVAEFRDSLDSLAELGRNLDKMQNEVKDAVGSGAGNAPASAKDAAAPLPSLMDAMLYAPQFAGQTLIFLGTLFFFVLTRPQIYAWMTRSFPRPASGRSVERQLRDAEQAVSRYFLTITLINACLGVLVAVGLYLLGLPAPGAWGLVAFLLNYLLYLGPTLVAIALMIAGHMTFDGAMSYAPMVMYVTMNFFEGYFFTPTLVGQRLSVNPLLLFVTLTVWLWLWGPVGGIIALPVLFWVLVMSGQIGLEASAARPRIRVRVRKSAVQQAAPPTSVP